MTERSISYELREAGLHAVDEYLGTLSRYWPGEARLSRHFVRRAVARREVADLIRRVLLLASEVGYDIDEAPIVEPTLTWRTLLHRMKEAIEQAEVEAQAREELKQAKAKLKSVRGGA